MTPKAEMGPVPRQSIRVSPVTLKVSGGYTGRVTVKSADTGGMPQTSVTVTVYVVVTAGLTLMVGVAAPVLHA